MSELFKIFMGFLAFTILGHIGIIIMLLCAKYIVWWSDLLGVF